MSRVRTLAAQPVDRILDGAPVQPIDDQSYRRVLQGRIKPVLVMFYANHGQDSRNLATLVRFLAQKYQKAIDFYAYPVTSQSAAAKTEIDRLERLYGVDKVPGIFFYDNDKGKLELEREDYTIPRLKEYRTPSMFFWKTYYRSVSDYFEKNILD